jgi:tetratricopeptide (TPR) repeat protein
MDDASLLKKRGLAKKMRRSLEEALAIDADHVAARRELIDFYHYAPWIVGGNESEADRQLELLEHVDPAAAWATRGAHARDAGDVAAARDAYRKAVEAGPREPWRVFTLAVLEQELGRYAASIELLDEVLAADPDHDKAAYYRARASAMSGLSLDRGLECARRYVDHCVDCDDSDRAYGWWRRATILKRRGETDEARAAYREALRLDPDLDGARRGLEELP